MSVDRRHKFAGFVLDVDSPLLTDIDGKVVDLTPKALAILCILVENAGQVVSKEELIHQVWHDSFVEEANLSHHVFKLRKALNESKQRPFIETAPKRGYRFVSPLEGSVGLSSHSPSNVDRLSRPGWRAAVLCLLLVVVVAGIWLAARRNNTTDTSAIQDVEVRTIAVLPFVNESGSAEVEYLADGITETLIASLSQLPTLAVKPRSSVARFKGGDASAQKIASEINVQAVLFGRVTANGNDITLFLSLVDPATDFQIWGKQYSRKLSDLSVLQSEVGRDVAQSLEARLTGTEERDLRKNYSSNAEAYRLYLLGDFHWAKFTEANFWKAKDYYERAIGIDANYALAYTGVANTYSVLGANGHIPVEEARERSGAAARRAIELDDRLAEAHVSLGAYKMFYEWDLRGADAELRRALELNENYAVPHQLLAYALRAQRRFDEAIAASKRAVEIDPTNLLMIADLGSTYRFAGNAEEAIRINRTVTEMDPGFSDVYFEDGLAYSQLGDHNNALRQVTKSLDLNSSSLKVVAGLGIIHARAGNRAKAEEVIANLLKKAETRYVSPLDIALVYSALGDRDKAFAWLEKAYSAGSCWLFELEVDPTFGPLRDDPRYADLIRRVGLGR